MTVVTRFAPSPTGFLHIGGARTALFNWLFARHNNGKFLLRIEDTDKLRSTKEAVEAIFEGLEWLGFDWDDDVVFQASRADRHVEVAHQLVKEGKAYYCYCSPEELEEMKEQQKANGEPMRYNGKWRDKPASEAPEGVAPVVRIKAPQTGTTIIRDHVQGEVKVTNDQLDDMILLRADGSPTYMLSVVVDDHDMSITHVIRGDDHLTNTFRQAMIYNAMGWDIPEFAHIPLIHGHDGAKLSKRHGALGAEKYQEFGFLPEALRNYLLKLGWGHGDDEIISTEQAIEWFTLEGIGRSPSRFDMVKLTNLNGHYMREAENSRLVKLVIPFIKKVLSDKGLSTDIRKDSEDLLLKGMNSLKERAKTLVDLAESSLFYVIPGTTPVFEEKAQKMIDDAKNILKDLVSDFSNVSNWQHEELENIARCYAEKNELKLGKVAQPIRAALTGSTVSPPIFEVMVVLGKEETLNRINDRLK
ncbi:MAG: glutamate--tRNA ligase [Alphaproteobacteria bacterium]